MQVASPQPYRVPGYPVHTAAARRARGGSPRGGRTARATYPQVVASTARMGSSRQRAPWGCILTAIMLHVANGVRGDPQRGSSSPSSCTSVAEVLTYNPVGSDMLVTALAALPTTETCLSFYIHLPALANNKTIPRGPTAVNTIHERGDQFHAIAEFSFGGWHSAIGDPNVQGLSWREKGIEFRRRMVAHGYNTSRGDTWAVNELPSSVRHNDTVRSNIMELLAGLAKGDDSMGTPVPGLVYVVGMGSNTINFSVYHTYMENWLLDSAFWVAMQDSVRWWGQETYARPQELCVQLAALAERVTAAQDFAMHVPRLAANGPNGVATAKAFLERSYTPIQSACWHSDDYATSTTPAPTMEGFVALQVTAAASWMGASGVPNHRIALAWNDDLIGHGGRGNQTASAVRTLAASVADSIRLGFGSSSGDQPTFPRIAACALSPSQRRAEEAGCHAVSLTYALSTSYVWGDV